MQIIFWILIDRKLVFCFHFKLDRDRTYWNSCLSITNCATASAFCKYRCLPFVAIPSFGTLHYLFIDRIPAKIISISNSIIPRTFPWFYLCFVCLFLCCFFFALRSHFICALIVGSILSLSFSHSHFLSASFSWLALYVFCWLLS